MTSVNRTSPYFWKALMSVLTSGAGDFEGGTLKAMILGTNTTVDTEWDSLPTLASVTTLDEYFHSTTTYPRIELASILPDVAGTQAFLDFDDPSWPSLTAGTITPEHILIYVELDGADLDASGTPPPVTDRVPVALVDGTFTPDGTDFVPVVPANGLFYGETA